MHKVTFVDRLRYATDNAFSKGTSVLIGWLALLSLVIILIASGILWLLQMAPELSFPQLLWVNLMHTMDAGTVAGDSGSWLYLLIMMGVTLGGIFVLSTLIGILTTGIEAQLENLRKGRSRVIEQDHTVILGWSEQIFTILSELVAANANQKRPCIVVLAPKDKIEMDDAIRDKVGDSGRTRIVCRTGSIIEMGDLALTSLQTARSIIILAPEDEGSNPDVAVIKTLLAITNAPDRRPEPYHVVAEIRDPTNLDVARMVGKHEVEIILVGDLIARIIAQTCRQSGLSAVYTELLDFGGDEIYLKEDAALVGRTFGDAIMAFATSSLIGIEPHNGLPQINPPFTTVIGPGDRIIVVAEDDDKIEISPQQSLPIAQEALVLHAPAPAAPERALILGWNWRIATIINELDRYAAPGSVVVVVADVAGGKEELAEACAGLHNQAITFVQGDTTNRRLLDGLDVPSFNHVITLSYSDTLEPQDADARTLVTLLHLREIAEQHGHNFSIVSEMLDSRNRTLAEVTQADDFIVSSRLISLLVAQISENKSLNAVFADLFDADGAEIYLRPAAQYVQTGVPVTYYTVVEAARQRGEIAIGYRTAGQGANASGRYGVTVNPAKSDMVTLQPGDTVIIIANE